MQMHALEKNRLISISQAEKKKDYTCPECQGHVRLRSGIHRHPHFYHLAKHSSCRLSKKGLVHLLLQSHLKALLPGATIEKPFPSINRIADVFSENTVYEIQYSPMSLEEAKQRTHDYESLGLDIVWILHDHTYRKKRLRPMERYLRSKTCYYTNFTHEGRGVIYDTHPHYPVDLTEKKVLPKKKWPPQLLQRGQAWSFYHTGDLFDAALKGVLPKKEKASFFSKLKKTYEALLYSLVER